MYSQFQIWTHRCNANGVTACRFFDLYEDFINLKGNLTCLHYKERKIAFSSLLNYGFLAVPLAFAGFPVYVLAPDFYATKYDIKTLLLG